MRAQASGAQQMREEARTCFDRLAEEYDRCFLHCYIRKVQEPIAREMNPAEDTFILDVGCATAQGLLALRQRVKRSLLARLDISPRMIVVAHRKLPGHPGIDLQRGIRRNPLLA